MKDGRILPETLEVPAQTRFRLEVKNEGPGAAEFESLELKKELVLAPGVTRTTVFAPMKPGTYKFFDDFHPETGQGRSSPNETPASQLVTTASKHGAQHG